jgi:hypothetical protein
MTYDFEWPDEKVAEVRRLVIARHEALLRRIDLTLECSHATHPLSDDYWLRCGQAANDHMLADKALKDMGINW